MRDMNANTAKLSPAQSRMLDMVKAAGEEGIFLPWAQRKTVSSLLKLQLVRCVKIGEGNYRIYLIEGVK